MSYETFSIYLKGIDGVVFVRMSDKSSIPGLWSCQIKVKFENFFQYDSTNHHRFSLFGYSGLLL